MFDILLQLVIIAVRRFKEGRLKRLCSDAEANKRSRSRSQTLTGSSRLGLFPRKDSGHPRKDSGCPRKDSRSLRKDSGSLRKDSCCSQKVSGVPHKDPDFFELLEAESYQARRSIEMEFEETYHDSSVDEV